MTKAPAQEITQLHAEVCSALADPIRIMILYLLTEGPITVGQLAAELDIPQSSTSRHLKILRERGMVTAARIGPAMEYALNDARIIEALDLLRAVLHATIHRRATLAGVSAA